VTITGDAIDLRASVSLPIAAAASAQAPPGASPEIELWPSGSRQLGEVIANLCGAQSQKKGWIPSECPVLVEAAAYTVESFADSKLEMCALAPELSLRPLQARCVCRGGHYGVPVRRLHRRQRCAVECVGQDGSIPRRSAYQAGREGRSRRVAGEASMGSFRVSLVGPQAVAIVIGSEPDSGW
jgi:hypothetical protein